MNTIKYALLVTTLFTTLSINIGAQERAPQHPVTTASLVRSLLSLSDKADKAGLKKEADLILKTASAILNNK